MKNVFATPTMKVDGFLITAESNPYVFEVALGHFKSSLSLAEKRVEHLNKMIDFLEDGGFEFGKSLFGRPCRWDDDFRNTRPTIEEDYGYSYEVYMRDGDNVIVEYTAFPSVWGTTNIQPIGLVMLGIGLDKDALGVYCAKARMFSVDFRYTYSYRGGFDYTKVVSESLTGNERGMKASTMYKKLLENNEDIKKMIDDKNKVESVIGQTIAKYQKLYPTANVFAEDLYTRSRGRMHGAGKGIRIDFDNGSYIEMSVGSTFGNERMFRYLDNRVKQLELSDLCNHLSK